MIVACQPLKESTSGILSEQITIETGPLDSSKIFVSCEFNGDQRSCFFDTGATFPTIKEESSICGGPFDTGYAINVG